MLFTSIGTQHQTKVYSWMVENIPGWWKNGVPFRKAIENELMYECCPQRKHTRTATTK